MEDQYVLHGDYNGQTFTAEGENFNAAMDALASTLPVGTTGDVVDIDDAGCVGGSFRWTGEQWEYNNINSLGQHA